MKLKFFGLPSTGTVEAVKLEIDGVTHFTSDIRTWMYPAVGEIKIVCSRITCNDSAMKMLKDFEEHFLSTSEELDIECEVIYDNIFIYISANVGTKFVNLTIK